MRSVARIALLVNLAAVSSIAEATELVRRQLDLPTTPFNYCEVELPPHFLEQVAVHDNTPAGNPLTNEGATLGRVLFYDRTLSANGTVACASCHKQSLAFSDGRRLSTGFDGQLVTRNSMSLINLRYYKNGRFFWDERAASLEEQVLMPIENRIEMGHALPRLIPQLQADPIYPGLFRAAFGDKEVTRDRISRALAQFLRSIVSYRSKYDTGRSLTSSVHDEFPNFTKQENDGKRIFLEKGRCASCHLFSSQPASRHDRSAFFFIERATLNGLDGKLEGSDPGVGGQTGRQAEVGAFKVSSLRNVSLTAPYMHDGRFATLDRVIEHYSWGVRPHPNLDPRLQDHLSNKVTLPERQKLALIAFLETLTDHALSNDPRFSDPFRTNE